MVGRATKSLPEIQGTVGRTEARSEEQGEKRMRNRTRLALKCDESGTDRDESAARDRQRGDFALSRTKTVGGSDAT